MAESKVSVYNAQELKNTTDDALGNYLRSLSFKQDNTKTDIKLVVGWTAVIIAGAIFAADYKLGWEATKQWTAVAVAAYAVLNSFFTYWLWFVEKGLIFEGTRDGKKIALRTKTNKHDPMYYVDVTVTSPSAPTFSTKQIKTPFTTWFTADGFFVAQPFQQWLASSIETIGDADTKNAMRDQRDMLAAPEGDTIHVAQASGSSTGGNTTKRLSCDTNVTTPNMTSRMLAPESTLLPNIGLGFGALAATAGMVALLQPALGVTNFGLKPVPNKDGMLLAEALIQVYGIRNAQMGFTNVALWWLGRKTTGTLRVFWRRVLGLCFLMGVATPLVDGIVCERQGNTRGWNHWIFAPITAVLGTALLLTPGSL